MQFIPRVEIEENHRLHPGFWQPYELARAFDWQGALAANETFFQQPNLRKDPFFPVYLSYFGLMKVMSGEKSGLLYCIDAAKQDSLQAGLFANLSLAELQLRNRKAAVQALDYGLRLNSKSAALKLISFHLGRRRKPMFSFFSRDHVVNRWMGKLTYYKATA